MELLALIIIIALGWAVFSLWAVFVYVVWNRLAYKVWWYSWHLDAAIERLLEVPEEHRRFS